VPRKNTHNITPPAEKGSGAVQSFLVHGDRLISGCDHGMIKVWSTDTWACEHTFEDGSKYVASLVVHDGQLFNGAGSEIQVRGS
jgi:WD40 repeat protein